MAVKPSRKSDEGSEVTFFMTEVAEPGVCVVFGPSSSGVGDGYDDPNAVVSLPTGASGETSVAVGMLLTNVVDIDESKYTRNYHKNEVSLGGAVTILTHGWALTNMIASGETPVSGQDAFYGAGGVWSTTDNGNGRAGVFMTGKDADGYAKVAVKTLV